ncbi:MAG: c-type cytochrome biogenesis protein CcmI [Pseudomonadota bacterium]|nr:c-type cytochrome biogenesis protein CcmI [Pseudomonadota bacterium]
MMVFWGIALLMIAVGLFLLLPALLGKRSSTAEDNREQNIGIARERMGELKKELAEGTLTQETYQQTLDELEKGLLIDVSGVSEVQSSGRQLSSKGTLIALLVIVPLLSLSLYQMLGSPQYLDVAGPGKPATSPTGSMQPGEVPSMEEMISGLQKKTAEKPDDPNAWYLLGRLYAATDRFEESVAAYEKLVEVSDRQPTALVVLADSLAMTQGGSLAGRPILLVNEALGKEPSHTTALWMAGQAAADQKQYLKAIDYWQRASPGLKDNTEMQAELRKMIDETVVLAKQAGMEVAEISLPEASTDVSVSIEVTIDPSLLQQIRENDVLFIFARAVSGPPMPLAAIKRQARELPVSIVLDDSSLLRPGSSLSQFKQLKLGARVSHSGQPVAQSGDLQSEIQVIEPGSKEVILLHIDQQVP